MARASARHILVDTEEVPQAEEEIAGGADRRPRQAALVLPSGGDGNLGEFGPGQMVKEFDTVVFNEAVGEVHGPVKTQFGYHLLEVTSRS